MTYELRESLLDACRLLLQPVASIVMRCGVTWREFAELSKSVFVQVASEEFGRRGRPTNVSRVSILTGISRKEIKRQRELLASVRPARAGKTTDATRLLSGWHQDEEFRSADGGPSRLDEFGPAPSFESLFARYGGDTPRQTLLKELIAAGSVRRLDSGLLEVMTRYHMPSPMNESFLRFLGTNLYDHAMTLRNNLSGGSDVTPRFEGFAVDDRIDPGSVTAFKQFVDARAQQFLEEIDLWLHEHRADPTNSKVSLARLGVGLYAIEGQLPEGNNP